MNVAEDRIGNDFAPVFPDKDIICKDCAFRKAGVLGARNSYCDKYPNGKPLDILFEHTGCAYYKKDNG